jgi:hypothetical protein
MNPEIAWNLGLWRGEHGYVRDVKLAPGIDYAAYVAGYAYGVSLRAPQKPREARQAVPAGVVAATLH